MASFPQGLISVDVRTSDTPAWGRVRTKPEQGQARVSTDCKLALEHFFLRCLKKSVCFDKYRKSLINVYTFSWKSISKSATTCSALDHFWGQENSLSFRHTTNSGGQSINQRVHSVITKQGLILKLLGQVARGVSGLLSGRQQHAGSQEPLHVE